MKERPILMSGPMIRAILEGRKTVTRRAIKLQPENLCPIKGWIRWRGLNWTPAEMAGECPYGQLGDLLWVKETYLPDPLMDDTWDYYLYNDGGGRLNLEALPDRFKNPNHCVYRATWDGPDLKWRPSIHMPRWASRITLEITGVKVERLQDISEEDALAEGLYTLSNRDGTFYNYNSGIEPRYWWTDPISAFVALWQSINGKRPGCNWDSDPLVWVIEFKRIESES